MPPSEVIVLNALITAGNLILDFSLKQSLTLFATLQGIDFLFEKWFTNRDSQFIKNFLLIFQINNC